MLFPALRSPLLQLDPCIWLVRARPGTLKGIGCGRLSAVGWPAAYSIHAGSPGFYTLAATGKLLDVCDYQVESPNGTHLCITFLGMDLRRSRPNTHRLMEPNTRSHTPPSQNEAQVSCVEPEDRGSTRLYDPCNHSGAYSDVH